MEATAEHLRQTFREYQRRKSSVFARQVERALEALVPLQPSSSEQRLQAQTRLCGQIQPRGSLTALQVVCRLSSVATRKGAFFVSKQKKGTLFGTSIVVLLLGGASLRTHRIILLRNLVALRYQVITSLMSNTLK